MICSNPYRSKLRTIRFGAVETLLPISIALVDMLPKLNEEYVKQKDIIKMDKKSTKKQIEELEKSNEHLKAQVKKLEKLLTTVQKEFVKKRFNDSMPEIRTKIIDYLVF